MNLKEGLSLDQARGGSIAQTIKEAVDPGQLLLEAVRIFTSQKRCCGVGIRTFGVPPQLPATIGLLALESPVIGEPAP